MGMLSAHPAQVKVKAVAFDCHGVVVKSRPWNVYFRVAHFLYNNVGVLPLAFTLCPQLFYESFQGKKLTIGQILTDYPDLELYRDDIYEFIRLRNVIKGTIQIIKKLKGQGVIIILASNMAQDSFEYHRKSMPDLFDLFDVYYISVERHGTKKETCFYQCLRETIQDLTLCNDVDIVFIDDDQRNITKAQESKADLDAILFTTPEELEKDLIDLAYLQE